MAFAGVWDRFPTLEMYWAETMIGWLEYGLWQIDSIIPPALHADDPRELGPSLHGTQTQRVLEDRNYWGFLHDPVGVKHRDCIGYEKLMWGTDFAHAASEWPNSIQIMGAGFRRRS